MELQKLSEMAAKKICGVCGNPMSGFHYWYKGGWKCKQSSLNPQAAATQGTAPATPGATPTAPAPKPSPSPQKKVGPKATLEGWMTRHGISSFTVNPDGSVDVPGSVFLDDFTGSRIPAKFNRVGGDFVCAGVGLTTLENSPSFVGGDYRVNHNSLTSLQGFPAQVEGSVDISDNSELTSLDGLNGVTIGENFFAERLRKLTNLKGIHKQIKSVTGKIDFSGSGIKSHIVGLMMIRNVKSVDTGNGEADRIMNKHLGTDRDPITAQEEMIDAGLGALAG